MSVIQKILRRFLYWIIPEFRMLRDRTYDFSKLRLYNDYVDNAKHIIVYAPYDMSEVEIGEFSYVSCNSHISKTSIGKFCSIGPNFLCGWGIHPLNGISTSPMFYSTKKQNGISLTVEDKFQERKHIRIGNDVFIGANVTILDGVNIGDGAVIGAGAVVSKDIPPYAIAVGVPITIIKYRFSEQQRQAFLNLKWWNMPVEELHNMEKLFFNIDAFLEKYGTQ